jgi:hypothetical protein
MSEAERWLRTRLAGARQLLTMIAALPDDGGAAGPGCARAGRRVRLYAQVLARHGGREDALPLLAADALLTHAFEAQAEIDPRGSRRSPGG